MLLKKSDNFKIERIKIKNNQKLLTDFLKRQITNLMPFMKKQFTANLLKRHDGTISYLFFPKKQISEDQFKQIIH